MADRQLNLILRLRDEASKQLKSFGVQVERLQPTFQKMAVAGTAGMVAFGAVIGKTTKDAVELGESMNAVDVVFGDAAASILNFGMNASSSLGLAKSEFYQMATSTGALLSSTGKPLQEVAEYTKTLALRAADLASVFNTDVSDAMSAINQALRGETEAIRRYTGDVTDATLNQYLMAKGIDKTTTEMSEAEKRLVRMQVLLEQTAFAQDDFANTSDSLANQQRVLKAEFKDISSTIGEAFIPMMTDLLKSIRPVIESFAEFAKEHPHLVAAILAIGFGLMGLITIIGFFGIALGGLTTIAAALGIALLPLMGIILGITVVIAGLIALTVLIVKNWEGIKEFFINLWLGIKTAFIEAITAISTALTDAFNWIVTKITELGTAIWEGLQAIFFFIVGLFATFLDAVFPGWQEALIKMWETIQAAWTKIKEVTALVWTAIKEFFVKIIGEITDPVVNKFNELKEFFKNLWATIVGYFQEAVNNIKNKLQPIIDMIENVINGLKAIGKAVGGSFNFVKDKVKGFVDNTIDKGKDTLGVDDAVISPNGQIVSTHPDDWLIATKNPRGLGGGGGGSINITISGNSFMGEDDMAEKVGDKILGILKHQVRLSNA